MSDILGDSFCIYCQREFGVPVALQQHIIQGHTGSYAHRSILKARENNDE